MAVVSSTLVRLIGKIISVLHQRFISRYLIDWMIIRRRMTKVKGGTWTVLRIFLDFLLIAFQVVPAAAYESKEMIGNYQVDVPRFGL